MNPFHKPPAGATGQRGFNSAQAARADAQKNAGGQSFAIMQHRQEFAWVTPLELALARLPAAMMAGITIIEMAQ